VMNTPTDGRESDANAHNEHRPALYGRKSASAWCRPAR